jgi:hypothetical protein
MRRAFTASHTPDAKKTADVGPSSEAATMYFVLAKKQNDQMVFLCGHDPKSVVTAFTIDRAKRFESPGEALAFRAGMERHWKSEFIVHQFDGILLHSLDV